MLNYFCLIAISIILGRDVAVTATVSNFSGHFTEHFKNAALIIFPGWEQLKENSCRTIKFCKILHKYEE